MLLEFSDEVHTSDASDVVTSCVSRNHSGLNWIPADQAAVFHLVEEAAAVIVNELRFIAACVQPENRQS